MHQNCLDTIKRNVYKEYKFLKLKIKKRTSQKSRTFFKIFQKFDTHLRQNEFSTSDTFFQLF